MVGLGTGTQQCWRCLCFHKCLNFTFLSRKLNLNQNWSRESELIIIVLYHLQILSGSWDQHNVTSPYTTVVFESAGSFLAFQAQLNSSWIVLFLGIKQNRKLIWLLKQKPQHPFLFTRLCIKTKNKILHLLHLYSIKLEKTIEGLLQKLICKQFRVINRQHVSKIQKHCMYYIILCKWLVCLLTDSYKT